MSVFGKFTVLVFFATTLIATGMVVTTGNLSVVLLTQPIGLAFMLGIGCALFWCKEGLEVLFKNSKELVPRELLLGRFLLIEKVHFGLGIFVSALYLVDVIGKLGTPALIGDSIAKSLATLFFVSALNFVILMPLRILISSNLQIDSERLIRIRWHIFRDGILYGMIIMGTVNASWFMANLDKRDLIYGNAAIVVAPFVLGMFASECISLKGVKTNLNAWLVALLLVVSPMILVTHVI